jgi:hypothetical protein
MLTWRTRLPQEPLRPLLGPPDRPPGGPPCRTCTPPPLPGSGLAARGSARERSCCLAAATSGRP